MKLPDDPTSPPGDPAAYLSALVASRICHDLISPLGAIGNGIELLGLDRHGGSDELTLVSDSVAHAAARIRLFRVAFGAAGPGQPSAVGEITEALATLSRAGRVAFAWRLPDATARAEAKLALLAALCLESALPYGGRITLDRDTVGLVLLAEGRAVRAEPALWDMLRRPATGVPPPGLRPSHVQFALLPAEAAAHGRRLSLDLGETRAVLRL